MSCYGVRLPKLIGPAMSRTWVASLTAFSGGGRKTARYLTTRQGQEHDDVPTFSVTSSGDDARIRVGDAKFVGTDHVFCMGNVRIEAFSGVTKELYDLVKQGQVEEDRRQAYQLRSACNGDLEASRWNGPHLLPCRRHRHGPEHAGSSL